jgi:hypothetical protein
MGQKLRTRLLLPSQKAQIQQARLGVIHILLNQVWRKLDYGDFADWSRELMFKLH